MRVVTALCWWRRLRLASVVGVGVSKVRVCVLYFLTSPP